jgi:hypothetical protein
VLFRRRGLPAEHRVAVQQAALSENDGQAAAASRALGGGRIMEILSGECCRVLARARV